MLTFREMQMILCKRYKLSASEAAENVKSFEDCVFDKQSRLEWNEAKRDEASFHKHLDYLEKLGEEAGNDNHSE